MSVHKRSYHLYAGGLSPEWSRFLVLARYSLTQVMESRFVIGLLIISMVPVLIGMATIYLANSPTVQALINARANTVITINEVFFVRALQGQAWFAMLLTAYIGPSLVAADLAHNALPLYLSRPLSRTEYVLGKATVMLGLLSCVTWVPCLVLFVMQASMASGWFAQNYWLAGSIVLGAAIWIVFLALVSLAISAWVKWRIIATGMTFAIFFLPAGFGEALNGVLRTYWGSVLNLIHVISIIWYDLFRTSLRVRSSRFGGGGDIPIWSAWGMLIMLCCFAVLLLNQRLRAREVVRG